MIKRALKILSPKKTTESKKFLMVRMVLIKLKMQQLRLKQPEWILKELNLK